jgi:prolyl-tRNA synthetase
VGVRVHVDDRPQLSPGFKFNEWELRGVPLRLELGPRDVDAGTTVLSRRLGQEGKQTVALEAVAGTVAAALEDFQAFLLQRAMEFRDENTTVVDTWEEFIGAVATGWALALHCGQPLCEDKIKAETSATPRCIPNDGRPTTGVCVCCGNPATYGKRVIFGRAY